MAPTTVVNSRLPQVGADEILDDAVKKDTWRPLPLLSLIKRPADLVSAANYGMIALLDVIAFALMPLVWSTSVEFGGLSMSPASIGLWMAGYGLMNGVFQFLAFPSIVRRFGPRRVFITSILCFVQVYVLSPLQNYALHHSSKNMNLTAALLILLQLTITAFSTMGFGEFSRTLPDARSLKLLQIDKELCSCKSLPLLPTDGLSAPQTGSRR